jgi:hypothetical protein
MTTLYIKILPREQNSISIQMSDLATQYYKSPHSRYDRNTEHIPEQLVCLTINGRRFPGGLESKLRYHISSYLKDCITRRKGWDKDTWRTIDIKTFGDHFESLTPTQQVQHTKFIHNLQPLGNRKEEMSQTRSSPNFSLCPSCMTHKETPYHLLHCDKNPNRNTALSDFTNSSKDRSDAHFLLPFLYNGFIQWLTNPTRQLL